MTFTFTFTLTSSALTLSLTLTSTLTSTHHLPFCTAARRQARPFFAAAPPGISDTSLTCSGRARSNDPPDPADYYLLKKFFVEARLGALRYVSRNLPAALIISVSNSSKSREVNPPAQPLLQPQKAPVARVSDHTRIVIQKKFGVLRRISLDPTAALLVDVHVVAEFTTQHS